MNHLVSFTLVSLTLTFSAHAMVQRDRPVRDAMVTPASSQNLLDEVVGEVGAKYYLNINSGRYRYPKKGETLGLHSPHFAFRKDASGNANSLSLNVGVDGSLAHARVDEFFAGEGVIECRTAKDMVMLAIWREILGDEAFDQFIADIKDLNTFYEDIVSAVKELNPNYDKWTHHRKLTRLYQFFSATKDSWRSTWPQRLTDTITLDNHFFSTLVAGFMGYQVRGLLDKRSGRTVFGAPPGTFGYLANLPEYVEFHPDGAGAGMNGLITNGQRFMSFIPGIDNQKTLDVDYYTNMHFTKLFDACTPSRANDLLHLKSEMERYDRQEFKEIHFIVNRLTSPNFHWVWFDHQYLTSIYSRYVADGRSLDERLHEILGADPGLTS